MDQKLVNRGVLILVLIAISALFFAVVRPFIQPVFIAALFAAIFTPLYRRFLKRVGSRRSLASALTILTILFFVVVPVGFVFAAFLSQASDIANTAAPWIRQQLATPGQITAILEGLPFYEIVQPYRELALARLGELANFLSGWLLGLFQSATLGTFKSLLTTLIVLYTMFFFLVDGDRLLYYLLYYLPLNDEDEKKLLSRFTSVTRATLKGTAVIGFLQGGLAGIALWLAGIPSALFWAICMMLLSVVPGVGTAIIWLPAVIYLVVGGQYLTALLVGLFCAIVVGTIDNVLRPRLVGNDTQMHELMIFFSTLGGLLMFGFMGFVIGPIIAALFVTVWELYGDEFKDWLPTTAYRPARDDIEPPYRHVQKLYGEGTAETPKLDKNKLDNKSAVIEKNSVPSKENKTGGDN